MAEVIIRGIKYDTDTGRVTGFDTSSSEWSNDAVIESTVNNVTITSIVNNGFDGCNTLTSLVIPDSITSIGNFVFGNCTALISITLSNSLTSIPKGAFMACKSLDTIVIPNSVTSIGAIAFGSCEALSSIELPNSITTIDYSAFTQCDNLTSATLSENLTAIPDGLFQLCSNLQTVNLPSNIVSIGSSAFTECSSLSSIVIPDKVATIGASAFNSCTALTSIILSASVTSIAKYAFYKCSSLTSITIPESITNLGESVFSDCTGLTDIVDKSGYITESNYETFGISDYSIVSHPYSGLVFTPDSEENPTYYSIVWDKETTMENWNCEIPETYNNLPVTSIGDSAFYNCSGLTSITIGESVTSIGSYAFQKCSSLASIIIPNSVTSIGGGAFSGCSSLTSITIPFVGAKLVSSSATNQYPFGYLFGTSSYDGGTSTPQYYYGSSTSSITTTTYYIPTTLKSVTITGSSYIPYGAFSNCSKLTTITLPDTITQIGSRAFYNCDNLASLTIPTEVTSIEAETFYYCHGLTSVTIPSGVVSIGDDAFYYCNNLTSIEIPDTVESIGNFAFSNCSAVESVLLGEGLTSIGNQVFSGCSTLTSITIPKNVAHIGFGQFARCTRLASIYVDTDNTTYTSGDTSKWIIEIATDTLIYSISSTLPDTIKHMGDGSCYYREYWSQVIVPEGVISIGDCVFGKCGRLSKITLPKSLTTIGPEAFYGCSQLTSISLEENVISLGKDAFRNCGELAYIYTSSDTITAEHLNNYRSTYNISSSVIIVQLSELLVFNLQPGDIYSVSCKVDQVPESWECIIPGTYDDKPVRQIEENGFKDCANLVKATILDGINSIGASAFSGCSGLQEISLPSGLVNIDDAAFYNCSSLTTIAIPDTVSTIGNNTFRNCTALAEISLPSSLTDIKVSLFEDCSSLTNITLPVGITSIESSAFFNCSSLVSLTIPKNVSHIGDYIIRGCNSLSTLVVDSDNTIYSSTSNNIIIESATNTLLVGCKTSTVPEGVEYIADYAFYNIQFTRTSLEFPSTIKQVGRSAFENCGLQVINLSKATDTLVGINAFKNNDFSQVILSSHVKLSTDCFKDAFSTQLTTAGQLNLKISDVHWPYIKPYISEGSPTTGVIVIQVVGDITTTAFSNSNHYLGILLTDNSIQNIVDRAFEGCNNIKMVYLKYTSSDSYNELGDNIFANCNIKAAICKQEYCYLFNPVKNTILAVTVAANGQDGLVGLLKDWTELRTAYLMNFKSIGDSTFENCTNLMDKYSIDGTSYSSGFLTRGVTTSIGAKAFKNCSSLTKLTNSGDWETEVLTTIGDYAFESSGIVRIPFTESSSTNIKIGIGAFKNCSDLATVTFRYSETTITPSTESFKGCTKLTGLSSAHLSLTSGILGEDCFNGCELNNFGEVYVGKTASNAFKNCKNLTGVSFNYYSISADSISEDTFVGCSGLTTASIENSSYYSSIATNKGIINKANNANRLIILTDASALTATTAIKSISQYAFETCPTANTIVLPKSLESIDANTFSVLTSLTTIKNYSGLNLADRAYYGIAESVNIINREDLRLDEIFDFELNSTGAYTITGFNAEKAEAESWDNIIPISYQNIAISKIAAGVFKDSTISTISIPTSVDLEDGVFENCANLTELEINKTNGIIKPIDIKGCSSLVKLTIGNTVTTITDTFFDTELSTNITAYKQLEQLFIKDGIVSLTSIDMAKFKALTTLSLGASINTISEGFTAGNTVLTDINVSVNNSKYYSEDNCIVDKTTKTVIAACKTSKIPETAVAIGNSAFERVDSQLTTIPGRIKVIGSKAFAGHTPYNMKLEFGIEEIKSEAFEGCNFISLVLPSSLVKIGDRAFSDMLVLDRLTIQYNVNTIGANIVSGCTALKEIINHSAVKLKTNKSYYGILESTLVLEREDIPTEATDDSRYLNYTFDSATKTYTITGHKFIRSPKYIAIPEKIDNKLVVAIASGAFANWENISGVSIPNNVTSIGNNAFKNCSNLKEIKLNTGLKTIGTDVFADTSIKEVYFQGTKVMFESKPWKEQVKFTNAHIFVFDSYRTSVYVSRTDI